MSTGLGLAISKELVDAHGGSIKAESKINEGTCFTITLPIEE
jgi:signal transduction histidine kinase